LREYVRLTDSNPRRDRVALSNYGKLLIIGEIATVTSGRDQADLPNGLQYSVVRSLLSVEAGHVAARTVAKTVGPKPLLEPDPIPTPTREAVGRAAALRS
jgi:hypothetical protein